MQPAAAVAAVAGHRQHRETGSNLADSLTAKAQGTIAQLAAKPAADQLRKQADSKAAGIISEANKRADDLVAEAKRKAGQKGGGKEVGR